MWSFQTAVMDFLNPQESFLARTASAKLNPVLSQGSQDSWVTDRRSSNEMESTERRPSVKFTSTSTISRGAIEEWQSSIDADSLKSPEECFCCCPKESDMEYSELQKSPKVVTQSPVDDSSPLTLNMENSLEEASSLKEKVTKQHSEAEDTVKNDQSFENIAKPTAHQMSQSQWASETNPYILSLRHILVAFSYYSFPHPNPQLVFPRKCHYPIGYCQSHNFIVGLLLLVFVAQDQGVTTRFENGEEECALEIQQQVFWMLVAIIENILPKEMYGRRLEGARIQQKILWTMIIQNKKSTYGFQALSEWCKQMSIDSLGETDDQSPGLNMVCTPWFLSLYVNLMPIDVTLYVYCRLYFVYGTVCFIQGRRCCSVLQ